MRKSSGILLLDEDKKFILQHRDKNIERFPDHWAFFGGKIEENESPEEAARRELLEELCIKVEELKLVGEYNSPERDEVQFIFTGKLVNTLEDLRKQQKEGRGLQKFSFKEAGESKVPAFEMTILEDLFKKKIIG